MSLEALNKRVETDLSYLSFRKPTESTANYP